LDYLGRPNVIIRVLICGRKRQKKKSERGHMRKILPNVAGLEEGSLQKLQKGRKWTVPSDLQKRTWHC
jgi:hypothetical protein